MRNKHGFDKVDIRTPNVEVIDAICGKGKTNWSIQYMKEHKDRFNFIYVTPYLSEITRIKEKCVELEFKEPENNNIDKSKIYDLKRLIGHGENILTTHALFKNIDEEVLELLKFSGYILILDEVLNVINEYSITKSDLKLLTNSDVCKIDENKQLVWLDENYKGKFKELKKMSQIGNVHYYRNSFLFWTITPRSFQYFRKVFILTYLFKGQLQRYFYDMHKVQYTMKSVEKINDKYEIVDYNPKSDEREFLGSLINIHEDKGRQKINTNYAKRITYSQFSSTWLKSRNKDDYKVIKNNIENYFRNVCNSKNEDAYWTTLIEVAPKIKTRKNTFRLTKEKQIDKNKCNFVSHSTRATNEYIECKHLAYIYNRFMHPVEKAFFEDSGVEIDEELLAISDLLQWIFRSRIRQQKSINIYIPSSRMRKLLYDWIEYKK